MENKYAALSVKECRKKLGAVIRTIREEIGLNKPDFIEKLGGGMTVYKLHAVEYGYRSFPMRLVEPMISILEIPEAKHQNFRYLCEKSSLPLDPQDRRTRKSKTRLLVINPHRQIDILLAHTAEMESRKEIMPEHWTKLRLAIVRAFDLRKRSDRKKYERIAVEYGEQKAAEKPPPQAISVAGDL